MLVDGLVCKFHKLPHLLCAIGAGDVFDRFRTVCNRIHDLVCMGDGWSHDIFKIYTLTVKEIVEAQQADTTLKHFFKRNAVLDKGLELQLIKNKSCIYNKGRLVIPKPLQQRATMWYHHYLQHPGHTRL